MKIANKSAALLGVLFQIACAQEPFDLDNVNSSKETIALGLKTNQIVLDWKQAQDPTVKANKFTLLTQEVAGQIIARQWIYPGSGAWPLIDWSKVSTLSNLIKDQGLVIETTHAVAQSDEELARISLLGEVIAGSGAEAELWYENWILSLAKGTNTNLKRLAFYVTSGFGEDIKSPNNEDGIRAIDWNEWGQAFNQSDDLGKALLLVCMTDLAARREEFTKAAELHLSVFNGTNDDLKAIALYSGSKKLGSQVVSKWEDIAGNHSNPKMKSLAQEALGRE